MTCIVGLVEKDTVYIGGDSAGIDDTYGISVRADEKVFRRGDFVFGFAGSFRMGQLLRYSLVVPRWNGRGTLMRFMVNDFVGAVREMFKREGFARVDHNVESADDGVFLVGGYGCLWCVYGDYQVADVVSGYNAIGCGESYALGAIAVLNILGHLSPKQRIRGAMNAAAMHSAGVCGPFKVVSVKNKGAKGEKTKSTG